MKSVQIVMLFGHIGDMPLQDSLFLDMSQISILHDEVHGSGC